MGEGPYRHHDRRPQFVRGHFRCALRPDRRLRWVGMHRVRPTNTPPSYACAGFFTRKKPSVQLLVNGEPVLSAVNSASYAVHHSSGRLAAVGPHPAGNVTGLTLLDYLALPPKARVSISYQGEEGGEGFLGLRKR